MRCDELGRVYDRSAHKASSRTVVDEIRVGWSQAGFWKCGSTSWSSGVQIDSDRCHAFCRGETSIKGSFPNLRSANQDILQGLEPVLVKAIQDDADQFDRVIKARRLRDKTTDKAERKQLAERALEQLRLATDIPIEIARVCLQAAEKGFIMFDLGFRSARGDSGVAVSSALAGASGALSVVYLNLTSFKGKRMGLTDAENCRRTLPTIEGASNSTFRKD